MIIWMRFLPKDSSSIKIDNFINCVGPAAAAAVINNDRLQWNGKKKKKKKMILTMMENASRNF